MRKLLEVCIASLADAQIAVDCGADRLELNRDLDLDGLTPPRRLVHSVVSAVNVPVIAMARPRAGNFVYDATEFVSLLADVTAVLDAGAAGIAVGILDSDGRVDTERMTALMRRVEGKVVVFHRAFDVAADPIETLDTLISLGVNRVLTSGQRPTAIEGAITIRDLVDHAAGRIEILPAAGIRAENVDAIIRQTGCDQVHGTFRAQTGWATDPAEVRAARMTLDAIDER